MVRFTVVGMVYVYVQPALRGASPEKGEYVVFIRMLTALPVYTVMINWFRLLPVFFGGGLGEGEWRGGWTRPGEVRKKVEHSIAEPENFKYFHERL